MKRFIGFEESLQIISDLDIAAAGIENRWIGDIEGAVAAVSVKADHDNPAAPTAAMDGYAVRFEDQDASLEVLGDNAAGDGSVKTVGRGSCIKTFTGAIMPRGSDTLVPVENIANNGGRIRIKQKVARGFACRSTGETYAAGEELIQKGSVLGFSEAAVLASLNKAFMPVFSPPKVAVASSGSEILDIAQPRQNDAQIRSANHITLQVLARKLGASCMQLGVVADDKTSMLQTLQEGLTSSDIVITTGGVSVGDYDFTRDVIERLGAKVVFHGVRIKPGQHLLLAQKDNKLILALPGFAYSAAVTAHLYLPALLAKFASRPYTLNPVEGILDEDFRKPAGKTAFFAVNITNKEGILHADFSGKKFGSSADLTNLKTGHGLLMLDEATTQVTRGQRVKLLLI